MPRVSVIIPSFNHGKYVAEAIQSVLDQTYQDFEIVITDDGSTDNTVNEIRKFNDQRIRLFTFEKNRGAAFASRNCVVNAKGEYLAMLSSDDAFLPEKLEKQVRFLDEHPETWAVFTYAHITDEEGKDFADAEHFYYNIFNQPNRTRFEWLNHFFYNGNCLCHPSVMARRELYTTIGPPDPRYAQQGDLYRWVNTCLKHEIYIITEKLVRFRVRSGEANASGGRPEALQRVSFELSHIFRYYLKIDSVEDFLKVFPEAEQYGRVERDLIPYFLARIAIDSKCFFPVPQAFGLNLLFDLLGSVALAELLEKEYGFRHRDFIEMTGKYDVYRQQELKDCIVRIQSLETSIAEIEDNNHHIFNLERFINVKNQYIWNLEKSIKMKDESINKLSDMGRRVLDIENMLISSEQRIRNLEADIADKDMTLNNIEESINMKDMIINNYIIHIAWRLISYSHKIIDLVFPKKSSRRVFIKNVIKK